VPLVIRLPAGAHGGQRVAEPVALLDVAPTILEVLGLPAAPSHQGRGLLEAIRGGTGPGPQAIASEIKSKRAFIRWPNKAIVDRTTGAVELYDLEADPGETNDLAASGELDGVKLAREMALQVPKLGTRAAREIDELHAGDDAP
jgi:arylsulfatase A-like enzyme